MLGVNNGYDHRIFGKNINNEVIRLHRDDTFEFLKLKNNQTLNQGLGLVGCVQYLFRNKKNDTINLTPSHPSWKQWHKRQLWKSFYGLGYLSHSDVVRLSKQLYPKQT